jgi:trimethylamine---corrinoid protein Co-methyltransferase
MIVASSVDTRLEGLHIPMQLRVAAPALDQLHAAALRVLETTGVRFDTEEAREILKRGGVQLDGAVARFQSGLVEWALSVTPSCYEAYDREGRRAYRFGSDEIVFTVGAGCPFVLDWRTGRIREYTLADAEESAKLTDSLPQISEVAVTGFPTDVPAGLTDIYSFAARFRNSIKPMDLALRSRARLRKVMDLLIQDTGSLEEIQKRPFCRVGINTFSPLVYDAESCDRILGGVEYGLPVGVSGWPQLGGTGPVTVAGGVVVAHAEHLAGLVLVQLAREGTRFAMRGSTPVFDMRSAVTSTGSPERALGHVLLTQLGRHLGVPVRSSLGADAKGASIQSGSERTLLALSSALAGASDIGGIGWLDNCKVTSPELIVQDCEIADSILRFLRGVEVNEETLALEAIDSVGPAGNFLAEEHTYQHFRNEVWYPALWDRTPLLPEPGDDEALRRRARDRVQELLDSHKPPTIKPATLSALENLLG